MRCNNGFTRFIANFLGVIVLIALALVASRVHSQQLVINGDCNVPLVASEPVLFGPDGSIFVTTSLAPTCGPPLDCGPPEGFDVLTRARVERNNFEIITGETFDEVFGPHPGRGGAYRMTFNRTQIISLMYEVPPSDQVVRFTFEDNTDGPEAGTVTLSRCEGGLLFPVNPNCTQSFGSSGANFFVGTSALSIRCRVDPGSYFLVFAHTDATGAPACGGDQKCTLFFGTTALLGGAPSEDQR